MAARKILVNFTQTPKVSAGCTCLWWKPSSAIIGGMIKGATSKHSLD